MSAAAAKRKVLPVHRLIGRLVMSGIGAQAEELARVARSWSCSRHPRETASVRQIEVAPGYELCCGACAGVERERAS